MKWLFSTCQLTFEQAWEEYSIRHDVESLTKIENTHNFPWSVFLGAAGLPGTHIPLTLFLTHVLIVSRYDCIFRLEGICTCKKGWVFRDAAYLLRLTQLSAGRSCIRLERGWYSRIVSSFSHIFCHRRMMGSILMQIRNPACKAGWPQSHWICWFG